MIRRSLMVLLLLGAQAAAQTPELLALGKKEFEAGRAEYDLGHYEAALQRFEASYRLTGRPALLFNIGYVYRKLFDRSRKLDQLELAIDRFKTFLKQTGTDPDPQIVQQRIRVERDLKDAEDTLAREQAARASGEEALRVGEQFLKQGRIDQARAQLESFERSATAPRERSGVVRALVLRAGLAIAAGDAAGAEDAFARALTLDRAAQPGAAPPDPAPTKPPKPPVTPAATRLAEAHARARARIGATQPLAVSHAPPGSVKAGAPLSLGFNVVSDPMKLIAGVVVYYRSGSGAFSSVPRSAPGAIDLPRDFTTGLNAGATVEYYADVVDEGGAILEHLGTAASPFAVQVGAPKGPPLTKKWWFWVATGGAVVVAATAIGLGVGLSQPPPPKQIPIEFSLLHW